MMVVAGWGLLLGAAWAVAKVFGLLGGGSLGGLFNFGGMGSRGRKRPRGKVGRCRLTL
jgi:hypothetical protein